jgi:phosphatidylglycerophosphate synthase
MSAAALGEIIAMPQVPHWIGLVGLLLSFIMCLSMLAGQLWLFMILIVLGLALVVVEGRYARGLIGTGEGA